MTYKLGFKHLFSVCKPGYYLSGTTCTVCAVGSYSTAANSTACTTCPTGLTTLSTGSDSASDCGKYWIDSFDENRLAHISLSKSVDSLFTKNQYQ